MCVIYILIYFLAVLFFSLNTVLWLEIPMSNTSVTSRGFN